MALLEIASFTTESALLASSSGADRIELCDGFTVGGITPTLAVLQDVKRQVHLPIMVMIRPRGGDFVYTPSEYSQMIHDIKTFKQLADGFVFGILDANGRVDVERNSELVALAGPRPCTFHRAFDETNDLMRALVEVAHCGFTTILTSGGHADAVSGKDLLAKLVTRASELNILIMPGGGVRSTNLPELMQKTRAKFYHSSAVVGSVPLADAEEVIALKAICRRKVAQL